MLLGAVSGMLILSSCSAVVASTEDPTTKTAEPTPKASIEQSAESNVVAEPNRLLAELTIAVRGTMDGYSRERYPHWQTVAGTCNTREEVLRRDGENVQVGANCAPVSGSWRSPYDGQVWHKASDVDIDHVVPLAHSWITGAKSWSQERRKEFANDMARPQLLAVTDDVNQAKSDKAPDQWRPPLAAHWCEYASDWIRVKHHYQLTITVDERSALTDMLKTC